MNPKRKPVKPETLVTPEVIDSLLELIRVKFYAGHRVQFAKDLHRLLSWVVLYPSEWLAARGVTVGLPLARYKEIMSAVLIEAASFCEPSKVTYFPAYLRQVIRSHFQHHGDEIYDEAKAVRNLVENAVLVAGQARGSAPDPVAELAAAARLLTPKKRQVKAPLTRQLDLL